MSTIENLSFGAYSHSDWEGIQIESAGRVVAVTITEDEVEVTDDDRAFAARLVAAFNACRGISLERLESPEFQAAIAKLAA